MCHLQNSAVFDDGYVSDQLMRTFVMGLGLGILKKSKAGMLGAIGAHVVNNLSALKKEHGAWQLHFELNEKDIFAISHREIQHV